MALKPITLRLDEEEYEKFREYLSEFGDPDINVAYVVRAYIRDINRAMPFLMKSSWDLKNYFGFLGFWLKQVVSMTEVEMFSRMMVNPRTFRNAPGTSHEGSPDAADAAKAEKHRHGPQGERDVNKKMSKAKN